ncbi:MAG: acyltransferase [Gammaproteobacteria bacterium]|nr:acyltransferase [Gammaproteobacteria bacterium]
MRLHSLQYLRAIAAIAVVYSHSVLQVESYAKELHYAGGFGVNIFFVISGFIMVFISKPDATPSSFLVNRIRRVVPLYWFFTIMMAVILAFLPSLFKTTQFAWDTVFMSLAFIPHYSEAHSGYVWPILAPGWSLNYEMYFYLLFAASLFFTYRFQALITCTLITTLFVLARLTHSDNAAIVFMSDAVVFEFIFGMLLALLWKQGLRIHSFVAVILIIVGFAVLIFREQWFPTTTAHVLKIGIPSLLVVTGFLYIKLPHWKFFVLLGDASYALYLSHIFTLGPIRKWLPPLLGDNPAAPYLFVAIAMTICIIVSLFVHWFIDNWLLRHERLDALAGKQSQPSQP